MPRPRRVRRSASARGPHGDAGEEYKYASSLAVRSRGWPARSAFWRRQVHVDVAIASVVTSTGRRDGSRRGAG